MTEPDPRDADAAPTSTPCGRCPPAGRTTTCSATSTTPSTSSCSTACSTPGCRPRPGIDENVAPTLGVVAETSCRYYREVVLPGHRRRRGAREPARPHERAVRVRRLPARRRADRRPRAVGPGLRRPRDPAPGADPGCRAHPPRVRCRRPAASRTAALSAARVAASGGRPAGARVARPRARLSTARGPGVVGLGARRRATAEGGDPSAARPAASGPDRVGPPTACTAPTADSAQRGGALVGFGRLRTTPAGSWLASRGRRHRRLGSDVLDVHREALCRGDRRR